MSDLALRARNPFSPHSNYKLLKPDPWILSYKTTPLELNIFAAKDMISRVGIAIVTIFVTFEDNVLFSHLNTSLFPRTSHPVFHWRLQCL